MKILNQPKTSPEMDLQVKPIIQPAALQAGDTIGLAPLAGPWQEEILAQGKKILLNLGFRLKSIPHHNADVAFLAASDQERANIFQELYQDPEVSAIIACRGGYGSMRILPLIDFDLFRLTPKPIIGFSDISALLNVISQRTGLVTFHGPNLTSLATMNTSSLGYFHQLLTGRPKQTFNHKDIEIIQDGQAEGLLVGGNLTTLVHLLGTPFEPDWENKIVLLEDVGEAPYRLDRLLSQLSLAGKFSEVKGVLLGQFTNCGDSKQIWQRVTELSPKSIPIWANLPVGHTSNNHWFPIGLPVAMANNGILNFSKSLLTKPHMPPPSQDATI